MVWYNINKKNKNEKERDMGIIILTGKSCAGKDSVRRELEKRGWGNVVESGSKWRVIPNI